MGLLSQLLDSLGSLSFIELKSPTPTTSFARRVKRIQPRSSKNMVGVTTASDSGGALDLSRHYANLDREVAENASRAREASGDLYMSSTPTETGYGSGSRPSSNPGIRADLRRAGVKVRVPEQQPPKPAARLDVRSQPVYGYWRDLETRRKAGGLMAGEVDADPRGGPLMKVYAPYIREKVKPAFPRFTMVETAKVAEEPVVPRRRDFRREGREESVQDGPVPMAALVELEGSVKRGTGEKDVFADDDSSIDQGGRMSMDDLINDLGSEASRNKWKKVENKRTGTLYETDAVRGFEGPGTVVGIMA